MRFVFNPMIDLALAAWLRAGTLYVRVGSFERWYEWGLEGAERRAFMREFTEATRKHWGQS